MCEKKVMTHCLLSTSSHNYSVGWVNFYSVRCADAELRMAMLGGNFCRAVKLGSAFAESHSISRLYLCRLSHVTKYRLCLLRDERQAADSKGN